jgi:hypothetical protein
MQEKEPLKDFLENYLFEQQIDKRFATSDINQRDYSKLQAASRIRPWLRYWPILAVICSVIVACGAYLVIKDKLSQTISQNYEKSPAELPAANATDLNLEQRLQKKLTFEFKNTSIGSVLALIADTIDAKIVISPKVTGTVTTKLKNVPAKEALDVVLAEKGYGYIIDNDTIKVASIREITGMKGIKPSLPYGKTDATVSLIVTGIIYSDNNPSAVVSKKIVHEGDTVSGATIIKINRAAVEFEKNGVKWTQAVQQAPASHGK